MDLALAALAAMALASSAPVAPPESAVAVTRAGPVLEAPRILRSFGAAGATLGESELRPADSADTLVEYSRFYYQRLTVHRWGSYAMLPLFAAQYYAGTRLASGGEDDWAEDLHPTLAAGVATLFAVNTVTGLWNLWDGRHDPNERGRRYTHAALMLLGDAGFVATGILADEAEDGGGEGTNRHRAVAIGSMAVSTVGWLIMTDLFRRD